MKQYHHFRLSADNPGFVFLKVHADTEEKKFDLLKDPLMLPSASDLPSLVEHWLPPNRQWYLYEYIREFCPDYAKDTVAPLPTIPKPSTRKSPPPSSPSASNSKKAPPSAPVSKQKKAPPSAPLVPKRRKSKLVHFCTCYIDFTVPFLFVSTPTCILQ